MADVKISALPAATVPLAGTEVLPIVQSSTTRQVSVANLTAGRAISASSVTNSALTSGRVTYAGASGLLTDSATLTYDGTTLTATTGANFCTTSGSVGIGTASPADKLGVYGDSVDKIAAYVENNNAAGSSGSDKRLSLIMGGSTAFSITGWQNAGVIEATSTGGLWLGAYNGAIKFATGSSARTERMRITSTGGVLVGTTVDDVITNKVSGTSTVPSTTCFRVYSDVSNACAIGVTSTSAALVNWYYNGANLVGSITTNGTLTSYNVSSDYRLKENIAPMTGALAKVAQLKPVTYKWKSNGSDGQGFIAHELQAVVPDCVTGEKDAVDEDGKPKYQAMDTSHLIATLVSAIQELKAEFDAYKATHP